MSTTVSAPVARPRLVLVATVLASSLAFIDGSIVNVALPSIARGFGTAGGDLSWVVTGYLLPLSALLLAGGAAGDRYGRARLLRGGITVFAAASALCAFAPNLGWLVAGRLLQGIGAALLTPNSLAILGASFAGEARGRAVGTWAAAAAAASAAGPLLGGWLVDAAGWRSVFLVNLPVAAAALAVAGRALRDDPARDAPPLDLAGALLACGALAGLTFGLTAASGPGGPGPAGGAALALGAAAGAGFLAVERRRGEGAMMPLRLFASRAFAGLTAMTLMLYAALGGLQVLLPTWLIAGRGMSAAAAGATLLPLPLGLALLSPAAGRLAARTGARLPLTAGPVAVAAAFLLLWGAPARAPAPLAVLPAMAVLALGLAVAVAPLTAAVLSASDPHHTGTASGFNTAVARAGGLAATALLAGALGTHGAALDAAARIAALAGAGLSASAGACAFLLLGGLERPRRDG